MTVLLLVESMIATAGASAGDAVPRAVSLVGGTPTPIVSVWPVFSLALIATGAAVVIAGLLAYAWSRLELVDRAFWVLALRLGVRRSERRLLRDLANRMEIPPVALLLSGRAFGEALVRCAQAGVSFDPRIAERVRTRVFG